MEEKFREKSSEKGKKYICEKCDFICCKKSSYDRHISTLKHKTALFPKEIYKCNHCDYTCRYKSEYDKHISTLKHKNLEKRAKTNTAHTEKQNIRYYCKECDYTCQYSSLFEKHKNTSKHINKVSVSSTSATTHPGYNVEQSDRQLAQILEHHSKQTEELKDIIIHQSELHQQQMKEQQEQHNKQIQELLPKLQQVTTINNTNNTTTNNNTKFNLNFFLNEQCKDAISIQTFMRDLNIGIKELEHMGNVGYLQGMISIMSNTLCAMDIYKRPVHCTDLKRETIYIKDGDTWKKDNANNDDLKKVIDDVADVNYRNLQLWETQHPEAFECDTPDNIEYCKIALESLGGGNNNEEQAASKLNKIIKHVVREVYVK